MNRDKIFPFEEKEGEKNVRIPYKRSWQIGKNSKKGRIQPSDLQLGYNHELFPQSSREKIDSQKQVN